MVEIFLYIAIPYIIAFLSGFLAGRAWYDPSYGHKHDQG